MTFLHPMLALVGVSLVAIPILIHLLARRRRKPVKWGAMRFLLEAYKKQRKRMTLEQLILLATRCLILLLLALALGRPALEAAGLLGEGSGRTLYLLVDNSLTSQVRDGDAADSPTALDRHKAAARDILAALSPGDRAGLVTLGGPAGPLLIPPAIDPLAVSSLVERL
ncbi:MAG: BatA domain-containing protein, partial [Phycisphaerales bacterium]